MGTTTASRIAIDRCNYTTFLFRSFDLSVHLIDIYMWHVCRKIDIVNHTVSFHLEPLNPFSPQMSVFYFLHFCLVFSNLNFFCFFVACILAFLLVLLCGYSASSFSFDNVDIHPRCYHCRVRVRFFVHYPHQTARS